MNPYYTQQERESILAVINKHVMSSKFHDSLGDVTAKDMVWIKWNNNNSISFVAGQENWITRLHNLIAPMQNETTALYHFKSAEIGLKILSTKLIQLSALSDKYFNDYAELTEYHNRYGNDGMFPNHQLNDYKYFVYILCMTKDKLNQYFWKDFNNHSDKICFKFIVSTTLDHQSIQFKDVFYDSGYDLDFLNEIRHEIKKKFGLTIKFQSLRSAWAPYFYKREKFKVEAESRLAINYFHLPKDLKNIKLIKGSEERYFIELPFENEFFSLKIEEVTVSSTLNSETKTRFKEICDAGNIVYQEI